MGAHLRQTLDQFRNPLHAILYPTNLYVMLKAGYAIAYNLTSHAIQ
jgi:hypothetical protein